MTTRPIKMPEKEGGAVFDMPPTHQKRPDMARYLLQIDRQTKSSYATLEEAHKAGLTIKRAHPVVKVSVYDRIESITTAIDLPAA